MKPVCSYVYHEDVCTFGFALGYNQNFLGIVVAVAFFTFHIGFIET